MTMLALAGVWAALHQPQRRCRWLAAASLAYGLAVASRPSLLFGAIILLAPLVQAWREKRREWSLFLAAFVPIVLIGLGLMYYNALRFDNPLDFGQHYQLSATRQNTLEQFSLRYLWFNFQIAFLEPAHWSGYFPFVHDIAEPSLPKGAGEAEHPFGILTNIPLVWLVLAVPLAWRSRSAEDLSSLRWFLGVVALLFGICALTIGLYFTMCLRYEVEFTHELVLLAVIGILGLERVLAGQPAWRRVARCGWGLLLTFSVAFNLFASFNLRAEAHNNLGMVLEQKGGVDEAITQFREALKLDPACMLARNNLGIALGQKGRLDEAIIQFRKASELDPDSPIAYSNLGLALEQKGRLDEAITQFQNALQITPDQADIHFNLGNVLLQRRRLDEAITQFQNALLIKPDIAKAQNNLGDALLQKGNMGEAMIHFQKALQLEPSDPGFQYNLAWLLAVCPEVSLRNGNKAVELARQANTLTGGKNPIVLHILAASFAEAGQFSDALETAQSALPLAEMQSNTMLARQLQFEMKLYRASSPYHLPAQKH